MKFIATLILGILFCSNSYAQNGTLEEKSFVHNDSLRTYLIYVPADYDGQEAWPLVMNYHGFRSSPAFQMNYTAMNVAADSMHFLVAYPQGLIVTNFIGSGPGWALPNVQSENDDVSFSENLIDHIATDYNVDMNRVHATGWSNGSVMAYHVACSLPDRIASVAGVDAQMSFVVLDACETGRPVSAMHFHGTRDAIVPFAGVPDLFPPAPSTSTFWAQQNNCAPGSIVTELENVSVDDSTTVTRTEYIDCDEETEVVFYQINDGGHTWPGSTPVPGFEFLGHTNQDVHATTEILAFFDRNPKTTVSASNGTLEEKSFVHNDSLRTYLMYVPADYDGQEPWPFVINYHGFRTGAGFQINFSQMNVAADSMNFLVAYPQGLIVTGMLGPGVGWAIPNVQSENDDVSFSNELIDHVASEYNVDMDRIHATGWSQGSAMAYYLTCSSPDRIASIAGVAGQMPLLVQENCEPGRPISAMHFQGTLDPIVPFEGIPGVWSSAPETSSFWAENNNCAPDSVVTELDDISSSDSTTVTRIEYVDCTNDTEVVFYRINDGGHPWPGSTPVPGFEFLGHTNQDINATAEVLAFFRRNPKTVSTSTEEAYFPSEIALDVFPNPFLERLTMEFQVQNVTSVKLSLYNVLGQKMHTIVDKTASTGPHRIEWSASKMSLPAGMYFIQLQVGEELVTKPIIRVSR